MAKLPSPGLGGQHRQEFEGVLEDKFHAEARRRGVAEKSKARRLLAFGTEALGTEALGTEALRTHALKTNSSTMSSRLLRASA